MDILQIHEPQNNFTDWESDFNYIKKNSLSISPSALQFIMLLSFEEHD